MGSESLFIWKGVKIKSWNGVIKINRTHVMWCVNEGGEACSTLYSLSELLNGS
jgi:hypothetical protein